jgi:hypothetical protein
MEYVYFRKDNQEHWVTAEDFWQLLWSGHFTTSDLVLDRSSNQFLRADAFDDLRPYLRVSGSDLFGGLVTVGIIALALGFLAGSFDPPPPQRPRSPNYEPLSRTVKRFIAERDGYRCSYCGTPAGNGHVDHKNSRARGGSNRTNNLCWACAPCNLSKGSMNAASFRRRIV